MNNDKGNRLEWLEYVTKILSHETTIIGLKMMVKSGLEFFYFGILRAASEIPANLPGQFSHYGQIFLHWAAATLKGHIGFQNKKFYTTFHHHF